MEGEILTWKSRCLAAAVHTAPFAALWLQLLDGFAFSSDYTAVSAACQELQPLCFLTEECLCVVGLSEAHRGNCCLVFLVAFPAWLLSVLQTLRPSCWGWEDVQRVPATHTEQDLGASSRQLTCYRLVLTNIPSCPISGVLL